MKEKTNIDIATVKIIYSKYKQQIIYGMIILVSFLVFAVFTLPGIIGFSNAGRERAVETEKLKILQANLALLRSLDEATLDSQFQIVSAALPPNKDFEGILNAISVASGKSGALLDDYGFSVGSLKESDASVQGSTVIKLELSLRATTSQTTQFLKNLLETIPLSEVSGVSQQGDTVDVSVLFYYKPAEPSNYTDDRKLTPVSEKHLGIINTISMWDKSVGFSEPDINASDSASPF